MTVGIVEETDFGTDIAVADDLTPVWALASGMDNLALSVLRRITTPEGSLDEIDGDDEPYESIDIRIWLNARLSDVELARLRARLPAVIENEERILSCDVDVDFTFETREMEIRISGDTDDGPFDLVIAASAVTVEILSVNGLSANTTTTSTAPQVIAIVGEPGPPGQPGPAGGGGGTAQLTLDFGIEADVGAKVTSSGTEEVLYQRPVRMGDLGSSLTVAIIGEILSALGTATFRVRIGGTPAVADGTLVLTMTTASAVFAAVTASGPFTNPTGNLYLKVTGQSSAGGQDAMARPPVVTLR